MRKRRAFYEPSSSAKLANLVKKLTHPLMRRASTIRPSLENHRAEVANLAGIAGADWAINQLSTQPHIAKGWPAPCKAARMRLRKAVAK